MSRLMDLINPRVKHNQFNYRKKKQIINGNLNRELPNYDTTTSSRRKVRIKEGGKSDRLSPRCLRAYGCVL